MWFQTWERKLKESDTKDKETNMISMQTRDDITALLIGVWNLCEEKFKTSNASVIPCRINSDVIENNFHSKEAFIMDQIQIQIT